MSPREKYFSFMFNFLPILLRFELLSFAILCNYFTSKQMFWTSREDKQSVLTDYVQKFTMSIFINLSGHFPPPPTWLCSNLPVFQLFWPPWLQNSLHLWLTNACCRCPRWRALTTQ